MFLALLITKLGQLLLDTLNCCLHEIHTGFHIKSTREVYSCKVGCHTREIWLFRLGSWNISSLMSCLSSCRHTLILSGVTLSAWTLTNGTSPWRHIVYPGIEPRWRLHPPQGSILEAIKSAVDSLLLEAKAVTFSPQFAVTAVIANWKHLSTVIKPLYVSRKRRYELVIYIYIYIYIYMVVYNCS
jgi:hypothetical protein